jgi:hypothetical protein
MAERAAGSASVESPEHAAYTLLLRIAGREQRSLDPRAGESIPANRAWILDTYAECLDAVRSPASRQRAKGMAGVSDFLDRVGPADSRIDRQQAIVGFAARLQQLYGVDDATAAEVCGCVLASRSMIRTRDLIGALLPLGAHPGWHSFGVQPPPMLLQFLCEVRARSSAASRDGIPPMPIFALAKSASSYSSAVMQDVMRVPAGVVSIDHLVAYEPWAQYVAQFPMPLHDHMPPEPRNLQILLEAGVRRVVVQVRDPRQLVVSAARHATEHGQQGYTSHQSVRRVSTHMARWVDGWRVEAQASGIAVHVVRFEDMVVTGKMTFGEILEFFGAPPLAHDRLPEALAHAEARRPRLNYRVGRPDEWKEVLTREHISLVETACGAAFGDLYSFS